MVGFVSGSRHDGLCWMCTWLVHRVVHRAAMVMIRSALISLSWRINSTITVVHLHRQCFWKIEI
jgi:hypothetical protein